MEECCLLSFLHIYNFQVLSSVFRSLQDVVTSGSSILETASILRAHGLIVDQAVVLLNREQGGENNLLKHGIKLYSLATASQLMEVLQTKDIIDSETKEKVFEFIRNNQVEATNGAARQKVERMTLEERRERVKKPLSREILRTMIR